MARRLGAEFPLTVAVEVEVTVPFHDADPMGVTWHGNYFRYLEVARSALLRKIGYDYAQMTASGYKFPIVEARIKYVKPTTFGTRLTVQARLVEYENRLKISYVIIDAESGERMTVASTTQVAVRSKDGELSFCLPRALVESVEACLAAS